jgi:hypothetical protein
MAPTASHVINVTAVLPFLPKGIWMLCKMQYSSRSIEQGCRLRLLILFPVFQRHQELYQVKVKFGMIRTCFAIF